MSQPEKMIKTIGAHKITGEHSDRAYEMSYRKYSSSPIISGMYVDISLQAELLKICVSVHIIPVIVDSISISSSITKPFKENLKTIFFQRGMSLDDTICYFIESRDFKVASIGMPFRDFIKVLDSKEYVNKDTIIKTGLPERRWAP